MRKIWNIKECNKIKAQHLADELKISPLLAGILLNRGIEDANEAQEFLHPEQRPYYDPFLLPDMDRAVKRIRAAVEAREKIVIYGDYDADGITATTILLRTLQELGAWADYYIPNRFTEGYGINLKALKELAAQGTSLIITVDCGIKSVSELREMQDVLDFVVTDHHLPGDELPPAVAVVDAHRADSEYPCADLAGVGVAFKLSQALYQVMKRQPAEDQGLAIAALGTVADAVPLVDENRRIVAEGLKQLRSTTLVGLQALIEVAGLKSDSINSMAIGFCLAPRINVAGRLKSARLSVELLMAEDKETAMKLAQELNELNIERKALKEQIQAMAEEQLRAMDMDNARVLVVAGEGWHHGVLGLVASSLQEKYYLPTVVISITNGMGKGSCRSIKGYNLFEALSHSEEALEQFGGHEMAAGLTVKAENIDKLRELLTREAERQLEPWQFIPSYDIDMEISPTDITLEMVQELELLEPCGMKNESPLFACRHLAARNVNYMKDGKHLKFFVASGDTTVETVAFNMEAFHSRVARGGFDMVYDAGINTWWGEPTLQCKAKSLEAPVPNLHHVQVDREFMRQIYIFLRNRLHDGHRLREDIPWLAMLARTEGCTALEENIRDAVQVLLELGLLFKTADGYWNLNTTVGKMNLQDSPTFARLNN